MKHDKVINFAEYICWKTIIKQIPLWSGIFAILYIPPIIPTLTPGLTFEYELKTLNVFLKRAYLRYILQKLALTEKVNPEDIPSNHVAGVKHSFGCCRSRLHSSLLSFQLPGSIVEDEMSIQHSLLRTHMRADINAFQRWVEVKMTPNYLQSLSKHSVKIPFLFLTIQHSIQI